MRKVSVSFLSSKKIAKDLMKLENTNADYIHVDVMDGRFVKAKNNPYKALSKNFSSMRKRLDVHLMVTKPSKYIDQYAALNCEYITVHAELKENILDLIDKIKSYGIKVGLAVSPETDIELVYDYLDDIDQVLIMSVVPGAGGQEHLNMQAKIDELKQEIGKRRVAIAIDGGLDDETVKFYPSANIIVSGSYVIAGDDYQQRIDSLR